MTDARMTRRGIIAAGLGTAAAWSLGPRGFGPAPARAQDAVATLRLSDDLHVLTVGGGNVLAQTGDSGLLLVDGGPAATAQSLLGAAADLLAADGYTASGTVHTLFNTHWHPEQTGLNERVGRAGGTIIAQENTRLWLSTDITYPWDERQFEALPEIARPNRSFYDEDALDSGIEFGYLRHAAHTDGDLYVKFPEANVLAVGGAASGAGWPLVDWWTGGWIGGIVGTMELLLALTDADTRVVPAEGRILGREQIEAQYEMYNVVYERLAEMLYRGRGPDEAVEARPTAEFDAEMGPSDEFVRRAFESLWAYLSPDA